MGGSCDGESGAVAGLGLGLGHFAVGSYWILDAFFVPPADFALAGPPIVLGLAAILGFFPGLAGWAAKQATLRWPRLGGRYCRLLLLALAWTVTEWLRGHVFTGYPWNPLGHVWAFAVPLLQSAAVFGVYGLGLLTFLVLAAPAAGWRASFAALALVGLAGFGGQMVMAPIGAGGRRQRRAGHPGRAAEHAAGGEMAAGTRAAQLAKLIEMSRRPGFDKLTAVVWPETAPPFIVEPGSPALPVMGAAAPPGGYLLTGAARSTGLRGDGVWNSLLVIDPAGTVVAHYDKVHLVPLGEYIPFHKQLAPVAGFIGRGSFEEGVSRMTLDLPGLPAVSPVICYEVIFPAAVTGPGARPRWLLNVTNDAWFGLSSGPYQHLASARMRAVEEGLPMVRAANTGVSAIIDLMGGCSLRWICSRKGSSIIPFRQPATSRPTGGGATGFCSPFL